MEKLLKEEKKVEYLEIIYDLIFVYVIGRNNTLLHHIGEADDIFPMFAAYVLCTDVSAEGKYVSQYCADCCLYFRNIFDAGESRQECKRCEIGEGVQMLFNEKYGISHISYTTGRILIEHKPDEELETIEENFEGLIRGFARLAESERESLGMMQYKVSGSPYDFVFQLENSDGIVMIVEDMRRIDETVRYIKDSLADINHNMLYLERDIYRY